jgi:asparagine synthase (glutamine-hydrolysing)
VPSSSLTGASLNECLAKTKSLLEDSIQHHLISDVPVGVFLSGGLESTTITKIAAKYSASQLTTITASSEDEELSEGKRAAELAAKLGTRHIDLNLNHRDFAEDLDRIVQAMDQPSVDGVNTYFVAKAAQQSGLKVVLSGLGGDEIFWGYSHFKLIKYLSVLSITPFRAAAAILGNFANRSGLTRWRKLEFLRQRGILGTYLLLRGLFTPSELRDLLDCDGPSPLQDFELQQFTPETLARLVIDLYLQNQLLRDTRDELIKA